MLRVYDTDQKTPMSEDSTVTRIAALEARLEFQDETISQLNDALVVQQQRYFELDRTLKMLIRQLKEQSLAPDEVQDEPPPHY
jgi:SlyX protein